MEQKLWSFLVSFVRLPFFNNWYIKKYLLTGTFGKQCFSRSWPQYIGGLGSLQHMFPSVNKYVRVIIL